jgi:hypothetical protein
LILYLSRMTRKRQTTRSLFVKDVISQELITTTADKLKEAFATRKVTSLYPLLPYVKTRRSYYYINIEWVLHQLQESLTTKSYTKSIDPYTVIIGIDTDLFDFKGNFIKKTFVIVNNLFSTIQLHYYHNHPAIKNFWKEQLILLNYIVPCCNKSCDGIYIIKGTKEQLKVHYNHDTKNRHFIYTYPTSPTTPRKFWTCTYCNIKQCKDCCTEYTHHNSKLCKNSSDILVAKLTDLDIREELRIGRSQISQCCKTIVYRQDGCNHITCTLCKTNWCWACGFADIKKKKYNNHFETHYDLDCPVVNSGDSFDQRGVKSAIILRNHALLKKYPITLRYYYILQEYAEKYGDEITIKKILRSLEYHKYLEDIKYTDVGIQLNFNWAFAYHFKINELILYYVIDSIEKQHSLERHIFKFLPNLRYATHLQFILGQLSCLIGGFSKYKSICVKEYPNSVMTVLYYCTSGSISKLTYSKKIRYVCSKYLFSHSPFEENQSMMELFLNISSINNMINREDQEDIINSISEIMNNNNHLHVIESEEVFAESAIADDIPPIDAQQLIAEYNVTNQEFSTNLISIAISFIPNEQVNPVLESIYNSVIQLVSEDLTVNEVREIAHRQNFIMETFNERLARTDFSDIPRIIHIVTDATTSMYMMYEDYDLI